MGGIPQKDKRERRERESDAGCCFLGEEEEEGAES